MRNGFRQRLFQAGSCDDGRMPAGLWQILRASSGRWPGSREGIKVKLFRIGLGTAMICAGLVGLVGCANVNESVAGDPGAVDPNVIDPDLYLADLRNQKIEEAQQAARSSRHSLPSWVPHRESPSSDRSQ